MYRLEQAVKDYGLKELALAMENVLMHKVYYDIVHVAENSDDSEASCLKNMTDLGEAKNLDLLRADMAFPEGNDMKHRRVRICIDRQYGEIAYSKCDCATFRDNTYSCNHIRMTLMEYFLDQLGESGFHDTELLQELRHITGVENPFIPGILRKTDESLDKLKMWSKRNMKSSAKPIWLIDPKKNPGEDTLDSKGKKRKKKSSVSRLLSAKCVISPTEGRVSVDLKAGPDHQYVIRHQNEFMDAYKQNQPFSFGKNTLLAGKSHFTKDSALVMDFFYQLYDSYRKRNRDSYILPSNGGTERRWFMLEGRDLDAFMDLMDGKNITVQDYQGVYECHVDLEYEAEKIQMKKETFGATLTLHDETAIGCGADWMYLRQNQCVFRLPADQWSQRKLLVEAGRHHKELYIQEKDLPSICTTIMSMDSSLEQVDFQGMLPEKYLPKFPKMQVYLDYPQDGMVSCELYAYYEELDEKYNIFDQKKAKGKRNLTLEQQMGQNVWGLFNAFDENEKKMYLECDEDELYIFLTETLPILSEMGEVFVSDQMKRLKVRPIGEVNLGLQVDAGSLLLSLGSNMMSRKEIVEVLSSYNRKKKYTRLKNGEFIRFDDRNAQMWEMLAETFKNYGKKNPEAMKVPLFRALYINEMLEERDGVAVSEGDEYLNLIHNLEESSAWDYEVPKSLRDIMRAYQKDGFRWIKMLKKNGFGGILADDMGLGKTLQILSFLLSEKEEGKRGDELRSLIITPASLVYNWKKEIETFTPELHCQIIAGTVTERQELIRKIKEGEDEVFITSYDLLKRDLAEYDGVTFANEIIDEAQFIKNHTTQAAKGVRLVDSQFRMALTGTPIENRLSELWSIFDYLMPGFLYRYSRFRSEYETPVIRDHDEDVMGRLRKMVHPFILRRLKKDVLMDLPDKLEETITVQLQGEQRRIYDAYAERLRLFLDNQNEEEFQQGKLQILAELTKLRQICCGPEVFLDHYEGENAKKEACMELMKQAIDGGHKILLFSQFTSVLDSLCSRLSEEKIAYHRIDGSTKKEDRMELVDAFATDEVMVFCISLKAGGTGLNLTAADIVIHYDPWWNVAAQNQATDRTHRIGQKNTVVVYQLIAERTIEQQIVRLQQTKAQLAEDVLSGEGIASIMIDKEEILKLL